LYTIFAKIVQKAVGQGIYYSLQATPLGRDIRINYGSYRRRNCPEQQRSRKTTLFPEHSRELTAEAFFSKLMLMTKMKFLLTLSLLVQTLK